MGSESEGYLLHPSTEGIKPTLGNDKFKESYSLAHLVADKASRRALAPYLRVRRIAKDSPFKDSLDYALAKAVSFHVDEDSNLLKGLRIFTAAPSIRLPGSILETADLLQQMTNSAGVTVYIVDSVNGELFQCPRFIDSNRHRVNAKIKLNTTVACHVAYTKKHVWTGDILSDSRFPDGIGWSGIDIPVKAVVCAPIQAVQDEVVYIIELYRTVEAPNYNKIEAQTILTLTTWMGAAIHQNQLRLQILRQQKLNCRLLEFINTYFSDPSGNEVQIISDMMSYARRMLLAEDTSFYIVDTKSPFMEADWYTSGISKNEMFKRKSKVRLGGSNCIASYVAKTGELLNVRDLKTDERLKSLGPSPNSMAEEIRSALCAPLKSYDKICGIILLTNKKFHGYFDETDEKIFHYFASYGSLAMHHFGVIKELGRTRSLNDVNTGILRYHLNSCDEEQKRLQESMNSQQLPEDFFHFLWYPFDEHIAKMDEYILCLLQAVLGDKYMRENDFPKFVAMTKKCYRDVPYHNFEHAFAVTHGMAYILLQNKELFTGLELKALIIATIIHDVDHRAYTNSFLYLTDNSLAKLYSNSALEHHHFYVGSMLIQDSKLFNYLPKDIYQCLMNEIKDAILHTDLALHFQSRTRLAGILEEKSFNWQDQLHRFLLKGIMMTSCDLIGQTKPLPVAEKLVINLYKEFYCQGDEEKAMGLTPLPAMDRGRVEMIPQEQVKFISIAVIPCNDLLRDILPNTHGLLDGSIALCNSWQELIDIGDKKVWKPLESLLAKD